MAFNTFDFIGKLTIGKESDKFKPYEVKTSEKGWTSVKLLFNVIAGDNRHLLETRGGYFKDGSGKVFTTSKKGKDEQGNEVKGEKLEIPWKDRFNTDIVENVAEFKKFIVDLEEYGRRNKLEKALEKKNDGTLSEEDLKELGVEDIVKELELSNKKRKEFVAESDFTEYIHKVIASGKIDGKLFRVSGNIVHTEYKGKFYKKYVPTRIYLAEKDAVPSSTGTITIFFTKDAVDNSLQSKTNKQYISGYVRDYENARKAEIPCPIKLILDNSKDEENEKNKKLNKFFENQFTVKDKTWKEIGVKIKILEGSQQLEITDDMLTQEQKDLLDIGAITMNDIRREMGDKPLYGDFINEMIIINVARGYTKGRKDTLYKSEDFVVPEPQILEKETPKNTSSDDDNIFDGLDDIDI